MNSASLAGWRVVVTRPANQAEGLIQTLAALGAEPIPVALIQIVDPADGGAAVEAAGRRLVEFAWVVVTSVNAAERIAPWLDRAAAQRPLLAVVGSATKQRLGGEVDLMPLKQSAQDLADVFPTGAGEVLLLQPQDVGPESVLATSISAKGWTVHAVDAYRTVLAEPTAAEQTAAMGADAVLFASGSAVRSWVQVFGNRTPPVAIAIGPSTSQEMFKRGLIVSGIATDYSEQGLISALLAHINSL